MALLLVTGLPFLLVAVFGLWRYLQASKQEIVDDRIALAQAAALVTDGFISDTIGTAQTLALSPELSDPARRASLSGLLERARLANRDWAQVIVLDGEGRRVAEAGTPQPDSAEVKTLLTRVLVTGRPDVATFHAAAADQQPRVLIGVPLTFADHTQGMLLIDPSLSGLDAELHAQARGAQLQILLVGPDDTALVGSTDLRATLPRAAAAAGMFSAQSASREFNVSGVSLLITSTSVPNVNWYILGVQPSALAFASLNQKVVVAGIALVAALTLAGLCGWIFGSRLSLSYERLVEAREQAEHATRLRDSVLASVSHDLQNPLTAARGYVQLLQRRVGREATLADDSLVAGLAQIERAVSRMQVMVEELVDAARLEAGHDLTLKPTDTDLVVLTRQVAEEQGSSAVGHSLRIECNQTQLRVSCDAARIARVIANLLSNAIKYSPVGSRVLVELAQHDDARGSWASVFVTDEGIGIPASDLPHVLERFHRGRNAVGHLAGAGLGLAGARKIVELHGGTIDLDSQEGVGTTVRVWLPVGVPVAAERDVELPRAG